MTTCETPASSAPRHSRARTVLLVGLTMLIGTGAALACTPTVKQPLKVSRTIVLDADKGPHFGTINYGAHRLLRKNEVVLTYDDGPFPGRTEKILRALKAHCAKATFFAVGRMAMSYPSILAKVHKAGHTIGTHTWAHANLRALSEATARERIEMGMAAVSAAIEAPISPLFRFPFLSENPRLLNYVRSRDISSISVDVVPGDTQGYGPAALVQRSVNGAKRFGGGILLYHDIKPATAAATPEILAQLAKNGFKLVHLTTKQPYVPKPKLYAKFAARRARQKANMSGQRARKNRASGAVTSARIAAPVRKGSEAAARTVAAPTGDGLQKLLGLTALKPSKIPFDTASSLREGDDLGAQRSAEGTSSTASVTATSLTRSGAGAASQADKWRAAFKPVLVGEITQASIQDMAKPADKPVAVAALPKNTSTAKKTSRVKSRSSGSGKVRRKSRTKAAKVVRRKRVAAVRRRRAAARRATRQRRQRQPRVVRQRAARKRVKWYFNFGHSNR